jgi:type I restriction enzyme S subunit
MMKINAEMVLNTVIVLPKEDEQRELLRRAEAAKRTLDRFKSESEKYKQIRSGLMQDLLTGKVHVKVDEPEEADAHA